MTDLRDPLEDLVAEVPSYVAPDPQSAWAAGARRRVRRRVGVAGLVVVVVALAAGLVAQLPRSADVPPADPERGAGVDGYPSRIEKPLWTRALPDRPGPLAGLIRRNGDSSSGWYAVSPTGHLWRIGDLATTGDFPPALSHDGTRLGYLDRDEGYVVIDLVTGERTGYPEIGDGMFNAEVEDHDRDHRFYQAGQTPSFWSPDDRSLLLSGGQTAAEPGRALLLREDGSIAAVEPARLSEALPTGWLSADQLVWLTAVRGSEGEPKALAALVTDLDGHLVRRVPIGVGGDASLYSQWFGSVSPGGGQLATGTGEGETGAKIRFYYLRADRDLVGKRKASLPGVFDASDGCQPSWSRDELHVPTSNSYRDAALVRANGGATILADPRLGIDCSMWALDALSGERHDGWLFGPTSDSWLSWHWREVALGMVGALLVGGFAVLLAWRRRLSAR